MARRGRAPTSPTRRIQSMECACDWSYSSKEDPRCQQRISEVMKYRGASADGPADGPVDTADRIGNETSIDVQ